MDAPGNQDAEIAVLFSQERPGILDGMSGRLPEGGFRFKPGAGII